MPDHHISMPCAPFQDKNLSLRAKGMYALIMSLPSGWNCSIVELMEVSGETKHTVTKAVKELESYGYLERRQMLDEGRFYGMEYILKNEVRYGGSGSSL